MPRQAPWEKCTNRELLEWRLCDLGVQIEGSKLERPIDRLYAELAAKRIRVRPHCWLSEEWFSPAGVPGIAIPFYLAHPRLKKLERSQSLEVEGGTQAECLRLLRHEAGHAVQHAYRLQRRKKWRATFGSSTLPYPDYYRPRPGSRRYVIHLPYWYAQSHPDEDFAETFAVWLTPGLNWKKQYKDWPAIRKLRYVDELMDEIAGQKAPVRSRARPDPLHRIRTTLGEHYRAKHERYQVLASRAYDEDLRRIFPSESGGTSAARFLRRHRIEIRTLVARSTGKDALVLDAIMTAMTSRCLELGLRVEAPAEKKIVDVALLLAARSAEFVYRELDWHAL